MPRKFPADSDITATLARFASGLTYENIPERTREFTKDLLLDALVCALAGYAGEDTPKVTRFASQLAESQESSILGGGRRLPGFPQARLARARHDRTLRRGCCRRPAARLRFRQY